MYTYTCTKNELPPHTHTQNLPNPHTRTHNRNQTVSRVGGGGRRTSARTLLTRRPGRRARARPPAENDSTRDGRDQRARYRQYAASSAVHGPRSVCACARPCACVRSGAQSIGTRSSRNTLGPRLKIDRARARVHRRDFSLRRVVRPRHSAPSVFRAGIRRTPIDNRGQCCNTRRIIGRDSAEVNINLYIYTCVCVNA